jgi:Mn2+/Fe2+ NRAMP family transporter
MRSSGQPPAIRTATASSRADRTGVDSVEAAAGVRDAAPRPFYARRQPTATPHRARDHEPDPECTPGFWSKLRAGLITGAADDDPSGIGTYSQAGAQFGYATLWTLFFTYPLMVGIQLASARMGRVTGKGLAANIAQHYSPWLLYGIVLLLFIANTINIAADLSAMAAAVHLMIGGPRTAYAIVIAAVCLALQVYVPFCRYAPLLKYLTLALFAYVATVFVIDVPWAAVWRATLTPRLSSDTDYILIIVAILGTTISPYLFFWQASQEVEEQRTTPERAPLKVAPEQAPRALSRINLDTYVGMAFSNVVAFFVIVTAAATLHAQGLTDIQTAAQAAEALKPIAGEFAFALFAAGIVGTGMLAVPVLSASAAYAIAEAWRWPNGLSLNRRQGRKFYAAAAAAILIAVLLAFLPIDPMKALFWSAVVNGIVAVPVMAMMMLMAARPVIMGRFALRGPLRALGWLGTFVVAAAVVALAAATIMR